MSPGNNRNRIPHELIERIAREKETPILVIDTKLIREKYGQFHQAFHWAGTYYAVKANPHPGIVKLLHELGAGFEIASEGELELLLRLGVTPSKIISSNPVKVPNFIKSAYASGVTFFAFDSHHEIEKLSQLAPQSKVYVRLSVSNEDSEWPLDRKFGVDTEDAAELLVEAEKENLIPHGITFHVGSQCTNPDAWVKAIEKSQIVWESVKRKGIELQSINVGGGFPCEYTKPIPSINDISRTIREPLTANFPRGTEIITEPGRALVGEAGTIVSTLIAKAMRNGHQWLYLDVGVFNGLMEAVGGIEYRVTSPKKGALGRYALAGPSCDGMDVISESIELPELDIGDKVYLMSAGAYTTSYASHFDGFRIPDSYLL